MQDGRNANGIKTGESISKKYGVKTIASTPPRNKNITKTPNIINEVESKNIFTNIVIGLEGKDSSSSHSNS